ncbi:cell division protein DamX [Enterobacterales bacterium CwR94]|nr:cell division protein DamX [Enterobacterales bacterium CwR94]
MDEFKPEDELKADTSDRRTSRSRRSNTAPKMPVSRQHMMIGIGILVLLLLVVGIGSALNGPDKSKTGAQPTPATSGEKNIDLSNSSSMSNNSASAPENAAPSQPPADNAQNQQNIGLPPVSSTPTEAQPVPTPPNQQRVDLPGDLNQALSNDQGAVNSVASGAQENAGLPTAPATVSGGRSENVEPVKKSEPRQHAATPAKKESAPKPVATKPAAHETQPARNTASAGKAGALPSGSYTLQLSSASRSDTLNAWAKKQNLSGYHVYKTTRNGQPWYVLVSGSYASSADAKRAVSTLPAEVQAQKPWVKPVSQVKKEAQ